MMWHTLQYCWCWYRRESYDTLTFSAMHFIWILSFYLLSFLPSRSQRSISFRSESRTELGPPRPWSRQAPSAVTKRRDSKLWSETFDVRLDQMLSSKEIKRQEVRELTWPDLRASGQGRRLEELGQKLGILREKIGKNGKKLKDERKWEWETHK